MSKSKKLLVVGATFLVGAVLTLTGWFQLRDSKKLAAEGKAVTAEVLGKDIQRGRRGRKSYYVSVRFKTESGAETERRVQVSSAQHSSASPGGTVPVHYLPSDPSICQVGDQVETKWSGLVVGLGAWLVGAFLGIAKSDEDEPEDGSTGIDAGPGQDSGGQDLPKAA